MARRASTVLKAWLFHAEITAWLLALGLITAAEPRWAGGSALLALGARVAGQLWSRHSPVPMPYFMRWILLVPRGPHSPARVKRLLRPRSGERILEIGPGVGIHAIPIAAALHPDGVLSVLDVQREMLDDLIRRARRRGVRNIVPSQGNAQSLPHPDAAFDAAYLVSVLGEIPSPTIALAELQRVLKPGARLLICEMFVDPDFISLSALQALAGDAGFVFERQSGPRLAYTALFRTMAAPVSTDPSGGRGEGRPQASSIRFGVSSCEGSSPEQR